MRKKTTNSKDFLKGFDQIWKNGPVVKYSNPDAWSQAPSDSRSKTGHN